MPPRVRADQSVVALRQPEAAPSFFGTGSAKGPRSGRGDARGDARRVLTAASADRSSAGTRGVLRDARGGASSGSTRVTPRTLAPRPVAVRRVVSATRDRATAPGLGAGGRAFPPRAHRVRLSVARRAANDEGTSHEGNATAGAAADDDASSDAKKNEEVVGVEVPGPAGADAPNATGAPSSSELDDKQSPSSEKSPSRDSDSKPPAKPPANAGGVGNVFAWLRAFFQPARLLGLAVNGFLFLFAAQLFAQNTGGGAGGGATHLVPVSYSRFMTAVKGDDISKLTVDGTYLTWKPKQPFVIKRQGTGPLAMTEERIEVAYSAARPEDASVPYELLHKNKVEFGAIDKRHQSQKNVNTFLTIFVVGLAALQLNRLSARGRGGAGSKGGPGGGFMRGVGGGPSTSAGRMTGGKERGALAPPTTTFADVAGVDEAKEELQEIVDILKRPEHHQRWEPTAPPSGVLPRQGAPGTGKTLLTIARWRAKAGVPFISVSASEFIELYGDGRRARARPMRARTRAEPLHRVHPPSC